jgi:hypothetical protein
VILEFATFKIEELLKQLEFLRCCRRNPGFRRMTVRQENAA